MKVINKVSGTAETIFEENDLNNITFGASEVAAIVSDGVLIPCCSEKLDTSIYKALGNRSNDFIPALVLNVQSDQFDANLCVYNSKPTHKGQKPEVLIRTSSDAQNETLYKIAQYDVVFNEAEKESILWNAFRTSSINWMRSVLETCKTMGR